MTTYTVILPDDLRLCAIHRFEPSNGRTAMRWSVSVAPTLESDIAGYVSGSARHEDLQTAADLAVECLRKNAQNLAEVRKLFTPPTIPIDLDLDL